MDLQLVKPETKFRFCVRLEIGRSRIRPDFPIKRNPQSKTQEQYKIVRFNSYVARFHRYAAKK